jgi:hypothetical protein
LSETTFHEGEKARDSLNPVQWLSAFQFGFSLLAILAISAYIFLLLVLGVMEVFSGITSETTTTWLQIYANIAIVLLLFPSVVFSLLRLLGKDIVIPIWLQRTSSKIQAISILLVIPILVIGHFSSRSDNLAWLILPPFHVLAVGLPVLWIVWVGKRRLNANSPQRVWGILGSGMILGTSMSFILEAVAAVFMFTFLATYITATNPLLIDELNQLAMQLQIHIDNPETITTLILPYILHPNVMLISIFFFSVIVPIIEEAVKPIGVWLLLGRKFTPAQGFSAGLISGAGFAFAESLLMTAVIPDGWTTNMLLRIATAILHITMTGIMGWGLAVAVGQGRYRRLALSYLVTVIMHGLWNALSIMEAFATIPSTLGFESILAPHITAVTFIGLIILAIGTFLLLILSNITLNRTSQAAKLSHPIPPAEEDVPVV